MHKALNRRLVNPGVSGGLAVWKGTEGLANWDGPSHTQPERQERMH